MKTNHHKALFLTCIFASLALSAEAADRMRAGQWTRGHDHPGQDDPYIDLHVAERR